MSGSVQPYRAEPLQIARFFASHRDSWSQSTHSTYNSYFRAFYAWLQITDKRADNPMMKVGTPRYPDRVHRPVADRSLVTMLTARMHHRTRVMILCASLAGLRVSEIAAIKGEDVDLDRDKPRLRIVGKRGRVRYVHLHPLLIEAARSMPDRGWWFPANSRRPGEHVRGRSVSDMITTSSRGGQAHDNN